ncbi:MAG: DUF1835 domain-containing protein [Rhodobacterales bacterium]|nr:DUF1835 domain-containing protein [Rhodobacterales bacterium]
MIRHITNGDVARDMLMAGGLDGAAILPWRDVLHDGPIPQGLDDAALDARRVAYLGDLAPRARVAADMAWRAAFLAAWRPGDPLVLWFEHDLYDQLQILQVLDRLARQAGGDLSGVAMICIGHHPAVDRFRGLGDLSPAQAVDLLDIRQPVTTAQRDLAQALWADLRRPDPRPLAARRGGDLSALPFMADAITRFLADYPWTTDGLTLTERLLLQAVEETADTFGRLFTDYMDREAAPFLGDLMADRILADLEAGPAPLVARAVAEPDRPLGPGTSFRVTDRGRAVLTGAAMWDRPADRPPLWRGGVNVTEGGWRWDPAAEAIRPPLPSPAGP